MQSKNTAKKRFFSKTDEIREQVAKSGATDEELSMEIDEAIAEVRVEISFENEQS